MTRTSIRISSQTHWLVDRAIASIVGGTKGDDKWSSGAIGMSGNSKPYTGWRHTINNVLGRIFKSIINSKTNACRIESQSYDGRLIFRTWPAKETKHLWTRSTIKESNIRIKLIITNDGVHYYIVVKLDSCE